MPSAAKVPVNVVDKPSYCDFRFGTIVNRSPVVIGISTDGAAPILGQAIRRRIETLLPPALSQWAALAARVRGAVMERLAPGPLRRAFWERFADSAFTTTNYIGAVKDSSDTWYAGWTCNSVTASFGDSSGNCTAIPTA